MIKKIIYILAHAAVIFFAIILIALLVLSKIFSPQKIKALIQDNLTIATERRVEIESAYFNAFKGLSISNIDIYEKVKPDDVVSDSVVFFHIDKMELRYFLPALLKLELQVDKIVFDHPVFHLIQDSSGAWNFDDLIAIDTTAIDTSAVDSAQQQLPLTLDVKEISFKNLTIHADIAQRDSHIVIRSGGISLTLSETLIPKFHSKKFEKKVRSQLIFKSEEEPWYIFIENKKTGSAAEYEAKLHANLKAKIHSLEIFKATADISINEARARFRQRNGDSFVWQDFPMLQVFSLNLRLNGNAKTGDVQIDQLDMQLGEEKILGIAGQIHHFFEQPFFDLSVTHSTLNLDRLFSSFTPFLPDSIRAPLAGLKIKGQLSLLGTKLRGNPLSTKPDSSLKYRAALNIKNFSLEQSDPLSKIENLNAQIFANGTVSAGEMLNTRATLKFTASRLLSQVDTIAYSAEKINAHFYSHLDNNFLPDTINGTLKIGNVFDSPLTLSFVVKSSDNFKNFFATLALESDSLSLEKLTENGLLGTAKLALKMNAASLDSITGIVQMNTGQVTVVSEPDNLIFQPLQATGKLLFSADTAFREIRLHPSTLRVGEFADAFFSGKLTLANGPLLKLDIDSLIVKHARLWRMMPESVTEEMSGLSIRGKTILTAHSEINLAAETDSTMNFNGDVFLNGALDYPEQFISIGKIYSHFKINSNGFASAATGEVRIDSLVLIGVQDKPLQGIALTADFHMPTPEKVILDTAQFIFPKWNMRMTAHGTLDSLAGIISGNFRSNFSFISEKDTTRILNDDIGLFGSLFLENDIRLIGDNLSVTGTLKTNKLDVFYADLMKIDSLAGRVHFVEAIDLVSGNIISSKGKKEQRGGINKYFYDVFRPYYLTEQSHFSTLTIKSISVLNYLIENFRSDLSIRNEKIEIPNFRADIYGGNISGQISVDLGDGSPQNTQWMVKANIARLNSSLLLQTVRAEEESAELDMTLELHGNGVDPAEFLELSGFLYVTKIGVKFTDNMLQSLDPRQTDKSIQDTRRLLKWGYKPKLISVEIKHDNLYPTIHLVKGSIFAKLIPLNLSGGKIELARIPLRILFSSIETSSE